MNRILVCVSFFVLGACANFSRSTQSGYADNERQVAPPKSAWDAIEEQKAVVELGLDADSTSGDDLRSRVKTRVRLRQLERALKTTGELSQYYKYGSLLKSDDERVRFLELGSVEARQAYIRKMQIGARSEIPTSDLQELIDKEDISVGMAQEFVKRSWGDPVQVDVAGNPAFKNEKWYYQKYVPSSEGFRLQKRRVFFEGGRVVGWETE